MEVLGLIILHINGSRVTHDPTAIYGNVESEFLQIAKGVPQGSILGAVMFIFYLDDIFKFFLGSFWVFQCAF